MGNIQQKREEKLKSRQAAFDAIPITQQKGLKRPGSLNTHRGLSGLPKIGGRRRSK